MSFVMSHWPLWFVCLAMLVSAVIDGWKLKVPNWLTLPLIVSGWLLGLLHTAGINYGYEATGVGRVEAALLGTLVGWLLLLPVYVIGGMGGGDVKMQMGFGSWVGAFYGIVGEPGSEGYPGAGGLWILMWSFFLAVLIGGVIAAGMIVVRGRFRENLENTRGIVGDLFEASSVDEVAKKAAERKKRQQLLPYGIPLCIGFISYLTYIHAPWLP